MQLSALIPRAVLFGNPQRASPRLSPDGKRLAYLAPDEGVLNVWVSTLGRTDDRVVTRDRTTGIRMFFWGENSRRLLYLQDRDGDEDWHLYSVQLDSGEIRDLTPFEKARVGDVFTDPEHPDEVLVALNNRDPQLFDLHRLDLRSGELTLERENPGDFVGWLTDNEFRLRGATAALPDGGFRLLVSKTPESRWEPFLDWGPEDNGAALGFTPGGSGLIIEDSLASDTTELYAIDLESRRRRVLARDSRVDVGPVMIHPTERHVQAVGFNREKLEWTILDDNIRKDMARLEALHPGECEVVSRDLADRLWLAAYASDRAPVRYFVYDRDRSAGEFLFSTRPELEPYELAPMRAVAIRSRDGLDLQSYVTTPPGVEPRSLPLVLNVHGGPWVRDVWGYNGEAQWLANRGYAVLQVNYRGSTGFGKKFLNAGNLQWGAAMLDDLVDAVDWAVQEGVADRSRLAIYGGSYGGYAALAAAAFAPEIFACAVDIVGPSSLPTLIESVPPYWAPLMHMFRVRVGDLEADREMLEARSPLFHVDRMKIPMLIAQGANDPRVKQAESEQIVAALHEKGKDVDYLLFADEGHGFARPENRMAFYAAAEQFLARHLGGRVEPPSAAEEELLARLRQQKK